MHHKPILYIKPGCPWCRDAMAFFSQHVSQTRTSFSIPNFGRIAWWPEQGSQKTWPQALQ